VCNSPVRRIPAWGIGSNDALANSPDIMRKQADFAADWMDLLLSYPGKIKFYDWDGTSDTATFNRTTGGQLWSGLPGNPEKYSFFAVLGAPAREKMRDSIARAGAIELTPFTIESRQRLEQARLAAEVLVDVRIYTIDGVNAVTAATASLHDAIAGLERDTAPPVVTYTGNAGSYTVDQTIAIHCAASDPSPGSGIASTTCADINGPAYSFGLGSHTYSATAEDVAGNVASGSTAFDVTVTFTSVANLVQRFSTDPDVTAGLTDKLAAAAGSANKTPRDNQLRAFINQVRAQTGAALTPAQAQVLITLGEALR